MALEMPSSSQTQNENTGSLKLKAMKIRKMYSYITASHTSRNLQLLPEGR